MQKGCLFYFFTPHRLSASSKYSSSELCLLPNVTGRGKRRRNLYKRNRRLSMVKRIGYASRPQKEFRDLAMLISQTLRISSSLRARDDVAFPLFGSNGQNIEPRWWLFFAHVRESQAAKKQLCWQERNRSERPTKKTAEHLAGQIVGRSSKFTACTTRV